MALSLTLAACGSMSPTPAHELTDVPLPSGWTQLAPAPPGQPVPGLAAGTLAFRTADGRLVGYAAGIEAPAPDWTRVTSASDGYAFAVPAGWQQRHETAGGHDRFTLVPPGVDPSTPAAGGAPTIVLSWTGSAPAPDPADPTITFLGTRDTPAAGTTVFTIGGLGRQIVAVIPRTGGAVVIAGDARTPDELDAFAKVLASWSPR